MTSLVPQSKPGKDLDLTGDLAEVLRRISSTKAVAEPEEPAEPRNTVAVKKEALEALDRLSGLLQTIEFPDERRELSLKELKEYEDLASNSKEAQKALADAVEAVKKAFFGHLDTRLLQDNDEADLPRDEENGWFLVEGEQEIPGTGKRLKRELAESQPQISASALKALWESGKISRADYYGMTVHQPARAFDGDRFLAYLKKKPSLIPKLADIIVPGKMTARFWVRPVKKGKK